MSAVTSCPKCGRHVSLPVGSDHSVWVRCPLCDAQYPLQTAIDFVPPRLQIVAAPALGAAEDAMGQEQLSAAAAFEESSMFAAGGEHAEMAGASTDSAGGDVEHNGHHALGGHEAEDFDAALSLEDELKPDEDEAPFVSHDEQLHDGAERDSPEHVADEEFRFADEHDGSADEFGAAGEEANGKASGEPLALGDFANIAAKPPKQKKKVPLSVRLIGIGIFFGVGLLGCLIVYSAFLYFGIGDLFKIQKYFPRWVVAKSISDPDSAKNAGKPAGGRAQPPLGQGSNEAGPDAAKQPNSASADASVKDSAKPGPGEVAAESPAKADPATNPFANSPKPNDPDTAKASPEKLDPLGSAAKLPNLDVPNLQNDGKSPPDAVKLATDTKPANSATEKPIKNATTTPVDRPVENPVQDLVPKSEAVYSVTDLAAAIDQATQSSAALADAVENAGEVKAARNANYRTMLHLATVLTFVKTEGAGEQVQQLKDQVEKLLSGPHAAPAPVEFEAVGDLAGKWIKYDKRKESGIFAAGTLKSSETHGRLCESLVELSGGGGPIAVVTAQKPAVKEGSSVLIFGAIVGEPAKNIDGYEGSAKMVVFGGVLIAAPKFDAATVVPAQDAAKKPAEDAAKPPAGDTTK